MRSSTSPSLRLSPSPHPRLLFKVLIFCIVQFLLPVWHSGHPGSCESIRIHRTTSRWARRLGKAWTWLRLIITMERPTAVHTQCLVVHIYGLGWPGFAPSDHLLVILCLQCLISTKSQLLARDSPSASIPCLVTCRVPLFVPSELMSSEMITMK